MNKKVYFLLAFIPALATPVSIASASPLVSIGDNADVFFNGSSSLRWTSNLFRDDSSEEEDLVLTVSPGFELNVGRGVSNADLSIITRYDIVRYEDNDDVDTERFHIKALGSYRASKWDASGEIAFDELQTTTGDVNSAGQLVELDQLSAKLRVNYRLSPKFSVGSGFDFKDAEYTKPENEFADYTTWSVPVDLYYELTPKVDLSIGYRYSFRDTDSYTRDFTDFFDPPPALPVTRFYDDYETTTHFFNVGARGELLPKLTGFFKVGYSLRDSDSSIDETFFGPISTGTIERERDDSAGMLGLDADLVWAATAKLTHSLKLSRDFGAGGEGDATENTTADWFTSYAINANWSASASLGYTLREYQDDNGREDDEYYAGIRAGYTPNRFWSFSAGYRYSENDSSEFGASYEDHSVDFIASLRY